MHNIGGILRSVAAIKSHPDFPYFLHSQPVIRNSLYFFIVKILITFFTLFACTAHARPQVSATVTFTMANVQSKGYTVFSGKVYDLQSQWAGLHPGGPSTIQGLKGIDGTAALQRKHGLSYVSKVAQYQVGILAGAPASPSLTAGFVPNSPTGSGSFKDSASSSTARLSSKNKPDKDGNKSKQSELDDMDSEDDD